MKESGAGNTGWVAQANTTAVVASGSVSSAGSIIKGFGFSVTRDALGEYTITITGYSEGIIVTATPYNEGTLVVTPLVKQYPLRLYLPAL